MPALSPSMEKGKLVKWLKKEGEKFAAGDFIAEIETDKATQQLEAADDGILAKILVEDQTPNIGIGVPIAIFVNDPKHVPLFKDFVPDAEGGPVASTPKAPTPSPTPTTTGAPASQKKVPILSMPALSPSMETGKIAKWLIKEGDSFTAADHICEVETDKATLSYEAPDDGVLAKILVENGVSISVGKPIAIFVAKKSDVEQYKNYTLDMVLEPANKPPQQASQQTPQRQAPPTQQPPSQQQASPQHAGSRVIASPLARATALKKGIDISHVAGTGPNGRIIRADVDEYVPAVATSPTSTTTTAVPSATLPSLAEYIDIPNSNIRKITAERLTFSKQNIPHYYLTSEIVVDKLVKLREELNAFGAEKKTDGFKLSVNDFVIKAAALALRAVPVVNSEWRGDSIRQYHNVHINVAVNTPKGLLTPVLRDVDKLGLKVINSEVKAKATRATEGKSTLDDLQQGTFTISNLGMFGISQFSAVISPPQSAILAVSSIKKVPVLLEDSDLETPKVKIANVLTVTLSCDHRVIDGAVGAQWLQVFKDLLENPVKFLL